MKMNTKTLYQMAKAAATGATNALSPGNESSEPFFERYGGYPAYVQEYNRLVPLVVQQFVKGDALKILS